MHAPSTHPDSPMEDGTTTREAVGRSPCYFTRIAQREIGYTHNVSSTRQIGSSEAFLVDLDYHVLPGLPVRPTWPNTFTVRFNTSGNLLIGAGGSVCTPGVGYVMNIHVWNPLSRTHQTFYNSGHDNVVLAVEFLSDTMIASGSMDCTVRLGLLHEDGRADTQSIGTHGATVSALAVQYPNNNVLYSGGEDGRIIMHDIRQQSCTNLLACRQYSAQGRLQIVSLVFDPLMPYQAAVAGNEKFVRIYDVRRIDQCVDHFCPPHIAPARYKRRISGIAFSHSSELLVSYEWEKMYLFGKKMGLGHNPELLTHNFLEKLDMPTLYSGHYNNHQNVGVSFFGSNDSLVATGSQRGKFCIWRKKGGQLLRTVQADVDELMCLGRNPHFPMLCVGGTNVKIWSNEVHRERTEKPTSPIAFNDDCSLPFDLGQIPSDLDVSDDGSSD